MILVYAAGSAAPSLCPNVSTFTIHDISTQNTQKSRLYGSCMAV